MNERTANTRAGSPRCLQFDRRRVVQNRRFLILCQQLGDFLGVGDLVVLQGGEQNVALDRLEHLSPILAIHRQALPLHLTVDPLRHRGQQVDLRDIQLFKRQQADQRCLVDLRKEAALKGRLALVGDHRSHVIQHEILTFSDLHQLVVDQATAFDVQVLLDVAGKPIVEAVQPVLVDGHEALVEINKLVIDRVAVDVSSDKERICRLESQPLKESNESFGMTQFD